MRMIALNSASKVTRADMTYKCHRVNFLNQLLTTSDIISTSNAFLWTQVESCVAIICACLPLLKGPLTQVFPTIFKSITRTPRESYRLPNIQGKKPPSDSTCESHNIYARGWAIKDFDMAGSHERLVGSVRTARTVETIESDTVEDGGPRTIIEEGLFGRTSCV
jgi:hypothetical protein